MNLFFFLDILKISGKPITSAELLLDHGANLNAFTEWGDTAVHYAAFSGSIEMLK